MRLLRLLRTSTRALVPSLALMVATLAPALTTLTSARTADAQSAPPAQMNVGAAVNAVQSFYNGSQTFKSDFSQKFWVKAYNQEKSSHGSVVFAKPGKMHWAYADPPGNQVVSDGTNLSVYEASNSQMYQQTVNNSQYPAALSFLTGGGKLADTFDFEIYSGETMHFPGGFVLVGTPKQPTAAYTKVLFYVDTASSQVRRVMVIDGQGNRNRFDFNAPRINEPVGPTEFSFTPPPGTSIIRP